MENDEKEGEQEDKKEDEKRSNRGVNKMLYILIGAGSAVICLCFLSCAGWPVWRWCRNRRIRNLVLFVTDEDVVLQS